MNINNNSFGKKFYNALKSYIDENSRIDAEPKDFIYKDKCTMSFEIASIFFNLLSLNDTLQTSLLKEKDYNRLLRLENDSLMIENEDLYIQLGMDENDLDDIFNIMNEDEKTPILS